MNSIAINARITFSELLEIIRNLNMEEKNKIKELVSESTFDIPEWQKKAVMERTAEYLKNPSIAKDFDSVIKEIEDGL